MADFFRLLVIDDNEDDRDVYRRFLEKADDQSWQIFEAEDGVRGVELYLAHRPDCVLLDYSLPGKDGLTILAELLTLDPHAPVVMLTGQGSESVAVAVMKTGARDYLAKGNVNPDSLLRCIKNATAQVGLERRLEEKRRSLEIFSHAMAHDLKEPVRSIHSFASVLSDSGKLEDEERELVDYVVGASAHMENLIQSVSYYTALEAFDDRQMRALSLQEACERAEANLQDLINSRQAVIHRGELPMVVGDPTLLVQLLQNLIGNAVRHCNKPIPEVRVEAWLAGNGCHLQVTDNGPGIPAEFQDYVFEPFKRLVGREVEGSGLGLAFCAKIAELHGGSIRCQSNPGEGACFSVLLAPSEPEQEPVPAAAAVGETAAPSSSRLAEVLLVEDNPADVALMRIKLMKKERVQFHLHVVRNGREAVDWLCERYAAPTNSSIDLMLLDVNMPIMDGYQLLNVMADDEVLRNIPVCMLSTSSSERDRQAAISAGAAAYMTKPPSCDQFERAIAAIPGLKLELRDDYLRLYA